MSSTSLPPKKRCPGGRRKHPERAIRDLPTVLGKRALTARDLDAPYRLTRATLKEIPRAELPRVEVNKRVHLDLAEHVESFLAERRVAQ